MSEKRKDIFSNLHGGTSFHSFAYNGTLQPFVKLNRVYHNPSPSNAVFMGNAINSGNLVFFKDTDEVEIDQFPWEI